MRERLGSRAGDLGPAARAGRFADEAPPPCDLVDEPEAAAVFGVRADRERCGGCVVVVNGGNGQQRSTGSDQAADVGDGLVAGRVGQGLNGDDLDDQVVGAQPGLRLIEQVSDDDVPDGGTGEALPGEPDGCAGDVEAGGVEAEGGDVFGVGPRPQPTTTARCPAPESSCALAQ